MPLTPTGEQQDAIDQFAKGATLAIEAGAGTGKTSTLIMLAEHAARTGKGRGQYVAFNRSIVAEAKRRLPTGTNANTAHSLAFRAVGHNFERRLDQGRVRTRDVAHMLGLQPITVDYAGAPKTLRPGQLAGIVLRTVNRFCQTADDEPAHRHFDYITGIDTTENGQRGWLNNTHVRNELLPYVHKAWADLQSVNGTLPYRQGHYLKAWQLSRPRLRASYILFDEAQDANPVMREVIAAQTHCQLVWVGDSCQQIYEFTGAVNALEEIDADARTYLSQSWRFGQAIADVANDILTTLPTLLTLTGNPAMNSRVERLVHAKAILTRTNAEGIRLLLRLQRAGESPVLLGGAQEVVDFAKGAQALKDGRPCEHPDLACFETWGEVQDYVTSDPYGAELKLLVDLIDEFTPDVIITAIQAAPREGDASTIISTAHKAKGREWPSVRIGDDFDTDNPDDSERRLQYVAVTRAQHALDNFAIAEEADGEPTADRARLPGALPELPSPGGDLAPVERDR